MQINDIIEQAKRLKLESITISKSLQHGMFRSLFLGQGIEFDSCRDYEPNDDVRNIDWNLTARTGKAYIKLFREEHDINIFLVLDVSGSMYSESGKYIKYYEKGFELVALFLFAGVHLGCPIGALTFSDKVNKIWPIKSGNDFVFSLLYELKKSFKQKNNSKTKLNTAISTMNKTLNKKGLIFIISDFKMNDYKKDLLLISKSHDVIAIKLFSKHDFSLPQVGLLSISDLEEKKINYIKTTSKKVSKEYRENFLSIMEEWKNICIDCGVLPCEIDVDSDSVKDISQFLLSAKTKYEYINAIKKQR